MTHTRRIRRNSARPNLIEPLESRQMMSAAPVPHQLAVAATSITFAQTANLFPDTANVGNLATIVLTILPADQSARITLKSELVTPGGRVPSGTIFWGDGGLSQAQFIRANGRIVIFGQHVFTRPGQFNAYTTINVAPAIPDNYNGPPVGIAQFFEAVGLFAKTVQVGSIGSDIVLRPINTTNVVEESAGGEIALLRGPAYRINSEPGPGTAVRVVINWGDGTADDALLSRVDGDIHVSAFHAYHKPGNFVMTATLLFVSTDPAALVPAPSILTTQHFAIQVNSATGKFLSGQPGRNITGTVGTLDNFGFGPAPTGQLTLSRPQNGSNPAVVLKAQILWGDGTISQGVFRSNKAGGFDVIGAHTYSVEGTFRIRVLLIPSYDGTTFTSPFTTLFSLALIGKVPGNRLLPLTFPLVKFHANIPVDAQVNSHG